MGISGVSNAIDIAARLGLPPEVINAARNALQSKDREVEKLLASLKTERQVIVDLQSQAEKERTGAENLRNRLRDEVQAFQEEKQSILQQARENLKETRYSLSREAAELRKQLSRAESELKKVRSQENIDQARQALDTWQEKMSTPAWHLGQEDFKEPVKEHNISVGDKVWLRDMDSPATVISLRDSGRHIEVQVGQATMIVDIGMVQRTETSGIKPPSQMPQKVMPPGIRKRNVSLEIDLRGKRADAVFPELDRYLNDAYLANLNQVRIVHGFGTGALCRIVRDTLSSHPLVQSFRPGQKEEGGDGVTVAML